MCNKEKFWGVLAQALGQAGMDAPIRDFATFKARLANRERVTQMLDAALMKRTTAEWMERFAGHSACGAGVRRGAGAAQRLRSRARRRCEFKYADGRSARMIAGADPRARRHAAHARRAGDGRGYRFRAARARATRPS